MGISNTEHRIYNDDSREMDKIEDGEVDLIMTSPPYPMIDIWDDIYAEMNTGIGESLDQGDDTKAFELMHEELDEIWEEVDRVLSDDGIAAINIGDATRKIGGSFSLYPNHIKVAEKFLSMGYENIPNVLWHKPTNKANKFMGSGMIPPNAYVTLEHEYIMIFRKDGVKRFDNNGERYESAYFWEERNKWFSDLWDEITGRNQSVNPYDGSDEVREVAAAYPLEIPHRIINMYSLQGDCVLDPFWGTGTTTLASIYNARESVGYEIDKRYIDRAKEVFANEDIVTSSYSFGAERIKDHQNFVNAEGFDEFNYMTERYEMAVKTKQEKGIKIPVTSDIGIASGENLRLHLTCDHTYL